MEERVEPGSEPVTVTITEAPKPTDTSTLTRAEARSIPGGFGDPFRVIESVPSVVPLASGIPYFYIRGAPPGNVGYLIDGIRVPLLFHLGLGPSVIHPALVDRVDVVPGPYPELGRYAGGVVSGTLTAPRESFRVEGNLRAVDTGVFVEVPFDDKRADALVAGRVSYTALLFSLINSAVILDYWDYAGRFSYEIAKGQRLGFFAFGAYDHLANKLDEAEQKREDKESELIFDTMFHRVDLFYDVEVGPRTKMRYDVVLGWDQTRLDEEREARDRSLAVKAMLSHRITDELEMLAGFDLVADDYDIDLDRGDDEGFVSFFTSRTDIALGAYVVFPWMLGRLSLRPGLRADLYISDESKEFSFDPSISAKLDLGYGLALLQTHGLSSQLPSFIVPGPGFRPGLDQGGLQRSFSSSVGLEWRPDTDWNLKLTGYRVAFFDLNDALGTSSLSEEGFPEGFDQFSQRFDGTSLGLELSVKRRLSRAVGAILTYSLGRSVRQDAEGREFPSGFDRTHVATAALTADFGRGFKGGVRQLLYTGAPLLESREDRVVVKKRLPPFYRLDWRFEKRWSIGKTGFVSVVAEVLNSFLAAETLGEDCDEPGEPCKPNKLGPIAIPSIGVEGGY